MLRSNNQKLIKSTMVKYFYVLWWLSTLMELGLAGFWIELTNMRKYKHEIFRWNYVNLITCIHSNPMFFWYCSLISDIQIATCSRNSKNQPWNIMKILKYFPANGRFSTEGSRDRNRFKFWNFQTEPNQDQSEFKTERKVWTNKYQPVHGFLVRWWPFGVKQVSHVRMIVV